MELAPLIFPGAQLAQTLEPVLAIKLPAGHTVQLEEPVAVVY